ncbi:hypothetical protein GF325_07575 [Candidatus Bathyarchaeota archaeon]|nr:hypothetical protein [Candidatus Bathyarchaeota archaeon]
MTDVEGITNRLLDRGTEEKEIEEILLKIYQIFKNQFDTNVLGKLSKSVIEEVKNTRVSPENPMVEAILEANPVGLTVGSQGVGCRGLGDFFVHDLITKIATTRDDIFLSPKSMDDAGAVKINPRGDNLFIVSKMEGMHSRLSDFPFIAGFHVTRACLRDLLVKGARPISLMVDVHLGDDADVAKLFDFMSGIACVAELTGVPITAGSTLRIGGDMVIGTRITGGIAGIGITEAVLARKDIKSESDILMTEGAGGGTITTTALYNGRPDDLIHTLNIKFLEAMSLLLTKKEILDHVYCCTDVTNGGLRGDLFEIMKEADVGVDIHEDKIFKLVHPKVKKLLDDTNTDYLGVSLDSLLIFCHPDITENIIKAFKENNIKAERIGKCTNHKSVIFHGMDGKIKEFTPRFRESAYTRIKKIIGEEKGEDEQKSMNQLVKIAYQNSLKKKEKVKRFIEK